jgi:serine/threonine protein phosphatase 1
MPPRTFAIGDIHGELEKLIVLMRRLPSLTEQDTLVFLGDYLDRGPHSRQLIEYLVLLPSMTKAKVVCLRGNHEDAWLRVRGTGWDEFLIPIRNGCLATYRSFVGRPLPTEDEMPNQEEMAAMSNASFFPEDVIHWMDQLPYWYEDEHAVYVHAGLPMVDGDFLHPSKVPDPIVLLWIRTEEFFRNYRGKPVVFGHTHTEFLPQELSSYTPDDPTDLWAGECAVGLDTGCGSGGFLTSLQWPELLVYESR